MRRPFEILDSQRTAIGEITLRRRTLLMLDGRDVFEVKLGEEFLMSSLFHVAEEALADRCLPDVTSARLDVVVGGLGLGYTAAAALRNPSVSSLLVVDALAPVIDWHRRGLVPLGPILTGDARCRLVLGDFFAMAASPETGFDPEHPARRFHAILLDIDHTPDKVLHETNRAFYTEEGLRTLARNLHHGGVFGLWSDDPPDPAFIMRLEKVFARVHAEIITFENPLTRGQGTNTIYASWLDEASA